jgi:DNA-binding protein H-NS
MASPRGFRLPFPEMGPISRPMARESKTSASDVIQLLENLTVADLQKVIAAAEQQREARRESGKKELVEEFKARAAEMGLSLHELVGSTGQAGRTARKARSLRKGASASPPAAKFRNPETGETWSGRGRMPGWLKQAEEQGRSREDFAVAG